MGASFEDLLEKIVLETRRINCITVPNWKNISVASAAIIFVFFYILGDSNSCANKFLYFVHYILYYYASGYILQLYPKHTCY